MVQSDKPWPMLCYDVMLFFFLNIGTQATFDYGCLLLFHFASFSTQTTLLLSYESRKERNSVTGNVKSTYTRFLIRVMPIFRKSWSKHVTIKLTTLDVDIFEINV